MYLNIPLRKIFDIHCIKKEYGEEGTICPEKGSDRKLTTLVAGIH